MIEQSEALPWSLFAMKSSDIEALMHLSRSSILRPLGQREIEAISHDLKSGSKIAHSIRSTTGNVYHGLCVFGLESPTPVDDKAIALHVFSLDRYPERRAHSGINRSDVATALFDEVKRFCRTHGYTRIQCYVPSEPDTLGIISQLGFQPEGVVFHGFEKIFCFSFHLAPAYTGDPYDGRHVLSWIAEQLRLDHIVPDETSCSATLSLDRLNPDLIYTALGSVELPVSLELKGTARSMYLQINFGVGAPESVSTRLSLDDVRQVSKSPRLDMTFWPPPHEGISIAVEIRTDLFQRFYEGRRGAYFDSGSYGSLLEQSIAQGISPKIFFVDFETTKTNPRLIGLARVESVQRGTPDELWARWGNVSSWNDVASFERYRAIKRKMTAIIFDDLRHVDRVGVGLPAIGHSWTYVAMNQAYRIARSL